jgi:hypothetical protein
VDTVHDDDRDRQHNPPNVAEIHADDALISDLADGAPAVAPRIYPLPPPEKDARFSFGLLADVALLLAQHGYPRPEGLDLVDLQVALHGFLYAPRDY